jgi:chromosome segregation ATPase
MQLEKATARSSDAALAGWISSNDVTLFTTVLVVMIAMFLHARLSQGARENVQISADKENLAAQLASTSTELDASSDLLDRTRETLTLTQQERDQLQKQLVEKLDELTRLNAKLDLLVDEKGQLESERQSLMQTAQALTEDKEALTTERASLASDRASLQTSNVSLRDRLETISSQLAAKIDALAQVEEQRDRLKKQSDELGAIIAGLQQKLAEMNIDLDETQEGAAALRSRIETLEAQLAAGDKKAEEYLAQLKRAAALFQGLKAEKKQLEQSLTEAEQRRQAELLEEARNNQQLVGLTGRLERVAILFDASGSMRRAAGNRLVAGTQSSGGDRWAEAQAIAANWLQHLNVEQCVLIVFSNQVRTFPDDGSLADVRGEAGKAKRESLLQYLKTVNPSGWTNTHDALRKAYEYDIDAILLFSDGAPSKATSGAFDPAIAQQIYDLCRQHSNIPIHTIGLGNYFDENASTFLQSVAKLTGGTFRGW